MSEHIYWITAVATDVAAGNQLAGLIGPEPGDATSLDRGTPCYPGGTTFTPVGVVPFERQVGNRPIAAYYVGVAAKQSAYEVANEYAGPGPYPLLNALGINDAQVAWFKERVHVQAGTRETTEPNWRNFIESLGYTLP